MKNLLRLMEEFSILGMEPAPLDTTSGIDFMPQGDVAPEGEYELDADGNPLLDELGNPIMKVKPVAAVPGAEPTNCDCDHRADDLAAALPPPAGGVVPPAQGAIVPQLPPEDEFDFTV